MILHPVLAPVSRALRGRARVETARRLGERALARSAALAGRPEPAGPSFPRDASRAPVATSAGGRTWHFSTTNTRGLAAALVAPVPVGIDAEWLDRPRIASLLAYLPPDEVAQLELDERRGALALWSAKEAVLKLTGVGIAGMGRVRLHGVEPECVLRISFEATTYRAHVRFHGAHVLCVAADCDDTRVQLESLRPEVATR